tara:strand:+ start:39 stop:911 length:873 start_codon:yes stop_codon:yes gene_type:complete
MDMAEELNMVKDATPKKAAFMSKPYSNDDKRKKEEDELKQLLDGQKGESKKEEPKEEDVEPEGAEEKSFKKRYGDLRRHSQKQAEEFKAQVEELKKQLSQATRQEIKLPKSDEDIDAWAKEYPDVAAIVETIAIKKAKDQSKDLEERIKSINEMQLNASKEKAEVELLKIHPDFGEIRDSDDFHNWADEQPKWVQDALYENDNDARSAARAIDLYKADKNVKSKKPNKDAASDVAIKTTRTSPSSEDTKNIIKESDVQKMSPKEYETKSETIMEAIRSGRFVYDISGSAR